jgi:hypothetical protein
MGGPDDVSVVTNTVSAVTPVETLLVGVGGWRPEIDFTGTVTWPTGDNRPFNAVVADCPDAPTWNANPSALSLGRYWE